MAVLLVLWVPAFAEHEGTKSTFLVSLLNINSGGWRDNAERNPENAIIILVDLMLASTCLQSY